MESTVGRYLEGRPLEQQKLLRFLIDLCEGLGSGVRGEIAGRELVFRKSEGGRGFLRVTPSETSARLAFPRGSELFDPGRRLSGTPGFQLSLVVRDAADIDIYVRRLVEEACRLER